MKGFGKFLIVVGTICAILGVIGNVQLSDSGMTGQEFDFFSGLTSSFGVTSYLSAGDQFKFWFVQNRTLLLIGGIIAVVIGIVMTSSGNNGQQSRRHWSENKENN
ncbi:hypothetical protein AGMMS49992_06090 [Clostridia bacterium]|nr:hypothetical protein AGMMS49992_06090 [Clostridia bacterium]